MDYSANLTFLFPDEFRRLREREPLRKREERAKKRLTTGNLGQVAVFAGCA
jgi:hypothetical protein